jgi:putative copper resistance protein D
MDPTQTVEGGDILPIFDLLVVSRWVEFAALFVLFGAPLFWAYMGRERWAQGPQGLPRTHHATAILLRVAAPVAAISGLAWIICILDNMTGGFGNAVDPVIVHLFFFETAFGPLSILRLILLAAILAIVFLPLQNHKRYAALLVVSALLLINQAWFGHAAEGGAGLYGASMIGVYGIHILAAAAWVGGLPPLLFALIEQRASSPNEARLWTLDILSRYSLMGMVAVTLIVISGIANAGFRVAGSFGKLFYTGYGEVLFAKISVVAMMLVLAFFNRFVLMPKMRKASFNALARARTLRISVSFELILGIFVLGFAAVLGITPPPQ